MTKPGSGKERPEEGEVEQKPGRKRTQKKQPKTKPKNGKSGAEQEKPKPEPESKAKGGNSPRTRRARNKSPKKPDEIEEPENLPKEPMKKPRQMIREAMPGIVSAIIEEARKGSCQHFKSLMDQCPDAVDSDERAGQESLTELLLKEIGVEEPAGQ